MRLYSSKRSQGFSLLEAIVALTLVATVGLAVFSWINSLLMTVEKIETRGVKDSITRSVVEYLADINMMDAPEGDVQLGGYQLQWVSQLVEPIKKGKAGVAGVTEFKVGLYDVTVTVEKQGEFVTEFDLRQVGFHGEASSPF